MKVSVENVEKNKVVLEIEVEEEKVREETEKAYQKLKNKLSIPGFRKGKAPRSLLEARYGRDVFLNEALDDLVSDAYVKAISENNIEPIDKPEIEMVQLENDRPLIFKATVEVPPEVKLGEYKGVEVKKPVPEFDEEQVEKQIQSYRERSAELVPVDDEAVQMGHHVVIDFEGFIEGTPFSGGKAEGYVLEIGSGHFIPGFEEQIVGMKKGEEKDIQVKFPEDYHTEEFAGKDAVFKVKLQEIKKKVLPAADDELAKKVSNFETIQELREDIANKLKSAAQDKADREYRAAVLEAVMANAEVDIPEKMIVKRAERMIKDFSDGLEQQGMEFAQYLQLANTSEEKMKEEIKPEAENAVKADLVVKAVAEKEGISVSQEELEQEVAKLAERYKQDPEKLMAFMAMQGTLPDFRQAVVFDKTVDFLIKEAKAV